MPIDYPLERLGWENFERMAVALIRAELGPAIEVFGRGRDGGREATHTGSIEWSKTSEGADAAWDGYTVFQAKFHVSAGVDPNRDLQWLKNEVTQELTAWRDQGRDPVPRNLAVLTNARLSSVPDSGIDLFNRWLQEQLDTPAPYKPNSSLREKGLTNTRVLHRDTVVAQLNGNASVRGAFNLFTEADLLAKIATLLPATNPAQMRDALVNHGEASLKAERLSRFSVAGSQSEMALSDWIVDLPCTDAAQESHRVLRRITCQAGLVHKQSLSESKPRHIVLTGAPGNGKSTVASFLCQYFRANFLLGESLSTIAEEVRQKTLAAGVRLALRPPVISRWPIIIPLPELAEETFGTEHSFMRWVAQRISKRADTTVDGAVVRRLLRLLPTLFVFDGLDEVTSPDARAHVLHLINDFVDDADKEDADLLILVTTRPAGYSEAERLPERHFLQLDLSDFRASDALMYANHALSLRLPGDPERQDEVRRKFNDLTGQQTASKLARTPLQVVILLVIMEGAGSLPSDRYQLFWKYFQTVYDRESSKLTGHRQLFAKHQQAIESVHASAALYLQTQAQSSGDIVPELPTQSFRDIVEQTLRRLGHDRDVDQISEKIMNASMSRLVLIVPTASSNGVMFEIRSLQELMAARALTEGDDQQVEKRLSRLATSANWRNTWIFMAGRIFSDRQQHRYDMVTAIVEQTDGARNWPGWACPAAASLAADLLDDGMVSVLPRWKQRLVTTVLESIRGPIPLAMPSIQQGLRMAMNDDRDTTAQIRTNFQQYEAGPPLSRRLVQWLMRDGALGNPIPRLGTFPSKEFFWPLKEPYTFGPVRSKLDDIILINSQTERFADEAAALALTTVGKLVVATHPDLGLIPMPGSFVDAVESLALAESLLDPDVSAALKTLCDGLGAGKWALVHSIGLVVEPYLTRRVAHPADLDVELAVEAS